MERKTHPLYSKRNVMMEIMNQAMVVTRTVKSKNSAIMVPIISCFTIAKNLLVTFKKEKRPFAIL